MTPSHFYLSLVLENGNGKMNLLEPRPEISTFHGTAAFIYSLNPGALRDVVMWIADKKP